MFAALILLAGSTFPGGSANDFAAFLHEHTKRDVVIAQGYMHPVERAEIETSDFTVLARHTRTKTHLRFFPGPEMTLHDELLPPHRMDWRTVAEKPKEPKWIELKGTDVRDRKVTFATEGDERLDPGSLEKAHLSRPIAVHWMLRGYPLSVIVSNMDEKKFLAYVAKAAGGFLVENKDGYRLELDAEQLRTRSINMLKLRLKNDSTLVDPYEGAGGRVEMLIGLIQDMPRSDLLAAFKTTESSATTMLGHTSTTARTMFRLLTTPRPGEEKSKSYDPETGGFRTPAGIWIPDSSTQLSGKLSSDFHGSLKLSFPSPEPGKPPVFLIIELGY